MTRPNQRIIKIPPAVMNAIATAAIGHWRPRRNPQRPAPDRRGDQLRQLRGALVDSDGRVIGINTAVAAGYASVNVCNIGFAIAMDAIAVAQDLITST